jgi:hypothetical protein
MPFDFQEQFLSRGGADEDALYQTTTKCKKSCYKTKHFISINAVDNACSRSRRPDNDER